MDLRIYQIFFVLMTMSYLVDLQNTKDDVFFLKIGTYLQGNVEKTYWVPRYMKAEWYHTRPICKAYGFDILTISTLDEFESIAGQLKPHKHLFGKYIHIGGVAATTKSRTDWYWVSTYKQFSVDFPWKTGQPDFYDENENCLTMTTNEGFKFNDYPCYGLKQKFICESVRVLDI